MKRSGDEASSYKSSWQYFDSLSFLKDQFTARHSSGNLPIVEQNILDEDENSQAVNETDVEDDEPVIEELLPNNASKKKREMPSTSSTKGKKRKIENDLDVGTALVRLEENKLKILEDNKKTLDEDASFFDSLLPHVRKLAPQNKMLLRIKIQELVYSFSYGSTNQNKGTVYQDYYVENDSNPQSIASYITSFSDDSHL